MSIQDNINEILQQQGLPPRPAPNFNYTNKNNFSTLSQAFGLGNLSMLSSNLLGGTGWGLQNVGRMIEKISPFSGESVSENNRGLLRQLGYSDEQINELLPYRDSWITTLGNDFLDKSNAVSDEIKAYEAELLGDNPTPLANIMRGAGTSTGYLATGFLARGNPLTAALVMGAGEALSEAGMFMSEAHRQGKDVGDALSAANKSFLTNATLNTGLNYFLSPFGKWAGKVENPINRYLVGTASELANELLQEPSQHVIEQAATNSLNNGTGFLSELGESVKQWPETFAQLAPEVAGSTLVTQALLAPFHIPANYAYNRNLSNTKQQVGNLNNTLGDIKGKVGETEDLKKLQEERDKLAEQINAMGYNDVGDLYQSMAHYENLNAAIQNYGKTANDIRNEKITRAAEEAELQAQAAAAQAEARMRAEAQKTQTPPQAVINDAPINSASNAPVFTNEAVATPNDNKAIETPDIANEERNKGTVQTIRGTKADIRYRAIEANDLITSHNDNGSTNPDYDQDLQGRRRGSYASLDQIERISNKITPELLGENPLASDGAPVIGSDKMVESGNGRTMAIRRAYQRGNAENYRSWLVDNAEHFGLNPDYVRNMKNPVLVRERTSDIDRVKFASEANESSVSTMGNTDRAVEDAKIISEEDLVDYKADKTLAQNKDFVAKIISKLPPSEKAGLVQQNGAISRDGYERVKRALIAKAYNSPRVVDRLIDFTDDEIKNVSNALEAAAPQMAKFESSHIRPDLSISNDILQAVETLSRLKESGQTVEEFLGTNDLFQEETVAQNDTLTPAAKKLLEFFGGKKANNRTRNAK